jgi:hypothetical protein
VLLCALINPAPPSVARAHGLLAHQYTLERLARCRRPRP